MEVAAKRLLWGKIVNCGQTCIAPDYVLCGKETEKKMVKEFKKLLKEWLGDRPQESEDFGRIVSDRHFDRLVKLMKDTKGEVVMGEGNIAILHCSFSLATGWINKNLSLFGDNYQLAIIDVSCYVTAVA